MRFLSLLPLPLMFVAATALAQGAAPAAYPPDATALGPDAIKERLTGRVFSAKVADGSTWRLEFKDNGYMFFSTGGGYTDSGKWRVDGAQWCVDLRRTGLACSELWEKGNALYYRRASNGEIVRLTAN